MGFQQFEGKLVIVTGAGSGMGAVTARRFRDEGAAVVLTGRTREKLTKVVDQLDQERSLDPCMLIGMLCQRRLRQAGVGLVCIISSYITEHSILRGDAALAAVNQPVGCPPVFFKGIHIINTTNNIDGKCSAGKTGNMLWSQWLSQPRLEELEPGPTVVSDRAAGWGMSTLSGKIAKVILAVWRTR